MQITLLRLNATQRHTEFKSLICYRDDISIHLNEWKPGILCIPFCRNSCKICVKSSLRHKPLTTIKLLEITLSKVCTQAILARRRTFAVFIFSRLLLFHFFHILHICRVHLSLVFAAQGDTGGCRREGQPKHSTSDCLHRINTDHQTTSDKFRTKLPATFNSYNFKNIEQLSRYIFFCLTLS